MKKIISLLLVVISILCFASCGNKNDTDDSKPLTENDTSVGLFPEGLEYDYDLRDYVTLPEHTAIKLDATISEVTEEDVDNILRQALIKNGTSVEKETGAEVGDSVDYTSNATRADDGKSVDQNASRNIIIGDEIYLTNFTEHFIGASKGDTVEFSYTFSTDYQDQDLAGVTVNYQCKVNKVCSVTPATFSDEWVVSQKIENVSTCDQYREYLRVGLEETAKENNGQAKRDAMEKLLTEGAKITEYPEKEYNYYLNICDKTASSYASINGITTDQYITKTYGSQEAFEEYKTNYATEHVKSDLIAWYIVRETGATITQEEYDEYLQYGFDNYGASYGFNDISKFKEAFGADATRSLLYAKALDLLCETCTY